MKAKSILFLSVNLTAEANNLTDSNNGTEQNGDLFLVCVCECYFDLFL